MSIRSAVATLVLLLSGCASFDADGAAADSFQDDDPPIGCQTGTGGCEEGTGTGDAPGAPVGESCDNTGQCVEAAYCAAPFDDGEAGELVCRLGCIQLEDERSWCSDDASCCTGTCSARGLCIADEVDGGSDSTGGDSTGGDSTGSGSTGGDTTGGDTSTGGTTGGDSTGGSTG